MDATQGGEMKAMHARLGSAWGWIVAYGVASLLAGVIAVAWPSSTLVVIAIIFAAQLLVGAVYQFVFAFAIPNENAWLRALIALLSVFSCDGGEVSGGHSSLDLPVRTQLRDRSQHAAAGVSDVQVRTRAASHCHRGPCRRPVDLRFGPYQQISVWGSVGAIPVFVWEMSLAVWLIVKGFKPSPIILGDDHDGLDARSPVPAAAGH